MVAALHHLNVPDCDVVTENGLKLTKIKSCHDFMKRDVVALKAKG